MATSPGQTPAPSVGQAMVEALARKGEPPGARPCLDLERGRGRSISYRDSTGRGRCPQRRRPSGQAMNASGAARKDRPAATNATAKRHPRYTATDRQLPMWHAVATATQVTARIGARRWLLTFRCSSCPLKRHLAQAKALRDVMVRRTACGPGIVALHVALGPVAT